MIQISAWIRSLLVRNEAVMIRTPKVFITALHLWTTSSIGAIAVTVVREMQSIKAAISTVVGFQAMRFGSRATKQPMTSATMVNIAHGKLAPGPHSSLWGLMNETQDHSSMPTKGR